MVELDEKIVEVVNSLTETERSVLEGLEDFDFLERLDVVLILRGWGSEDIKNLTENQWKKCFNYYKENIIIV
ncbi:hypothetical protein IJT10_03640 [bacterium]|nr:hypothetical protein [bacterium]